MNFDRNQLMYKFDEEMLDIYYKNKKLDPPLHAIKYKELLDQYGGFKTAKLLLESNTNVQFGFTELFKRGALKNSVEYLVYSEPWRKLFDFDVLAEAKKRLLEYNCPLPEIQNIGAIASETVSVSQTDNQANSFLSSDPNNSVDPTVWRQIIERRGQLKFRNGLILRHGSRCQISSCALLEIVEASHIIPYSICGNYELDNGVLLRSDLHTLFDLNLLGINPKTLCIEMHTSLINEYGQYLGMKLRCKTKKKPSVESLTYRYKQFAGALKLQT